MRGVSTVVWCAVGCGTRFVARAKSNDAIGGTAKAA